MHAQTTPPGLYDTIGIRRSSSRNNAELPVPSVGRDETGSARETGTGGAGAGCSGGALRRGRSFQDLTLPRPAPAPGTQPRPTRVERSRSSSPRWYAGGPPLPLGLMPLHMPVAAEPAAAASAAGAGAGAGGWPRRNRADSTPHIGLRLSPATVGRTPSTGSVSGGSVGGLPLLDRTAVAAAGGWGGPGTGRLPPWFAAPAAPPPAATPYALAPSLTRASRSVATALPLITEGSGTEEAASHAAVPASPYQAQAPAATTIAIAPAPSKAAAPETAAAALEGAGGTGDGLLRRKSLSEPSARERQLAASEAEAAAVAGAGGGAGGGGPPMMPPWQYMEPPRFQIARLELESEATHMLEEVRMIMPGVQALFGFQFIAVFNSEFPKLLQQYKTLHFVCTLFTALAALCMLTPAAYHRHAEPHWFSRAYVDRSSTAISIGLVFLMASISLEFVVISQQVFGQPNYGGIGAAVGLFFAYMLFWFILPFGNRRFPTAQREMHEHWHRAQEAAVEEREKALALHRSLQRMESAANARAGAAAGVSAGGVGRAKTAPAGLQQLRALSARMLALIERQRAA